MRSNDNCQKIKLLIIYEMLRQETDEEHPMRTNDICQRLEQKSISCDRRTLAEDIQTLNEFGFEVHSRRVGKGKGYYIEDRSFSLPELKVLIDAVQASNTITEKKSDALIDKLTDLGGSHRSALLKRNSVKFNTIKHTNEDIYTTIEQIEKALRTNRKIAIYYFHLDENRNKIYHTENGKHIVEPISLIYDNNEYYLTCYDEETDENRNYRLDRIERVELLDDTICEETVSRRRGIAHYKASIFKMYGGVTVKVTLEFDRRLIGTIYDKFGEKTVIKDCGNGRYSARVNVQISPTFWGWVFQFVGDMKISEPKAIREEYDCRLKEALNYD